MNLIGNNLPQQANSIVDAGQVLFSKSYKITDKIIMRQSTVGDVIDMGEEHYFHVLNLLTAIPSDAKSALWDAGLDWEEVPDLQFFAMAVSGLKPEDTQIFIPGVDFTKFALYKRDDGDFVFADKVNCITVDVMVHKKILDYLCAAHKIKKKPEKAGSALTKQWLIEEDRDKRKMAAAKKDKSFKSDLMPLVSSMVNHEGFKYDYETVKGLPFGQFMDAAARVQLIVSVDKIISGIYAGTVDGKKIAKSQLDWTRAI